MLDSALADQLRQHLTNIRQPIELVATLDDSAKATELQNLLEEIAGMSDKITLRTDGTSDRSPVFDIARVDSDVKVTFGGLPLGHEFTSLVLALLHVGGHPPKVDDDVAEAIRNLDVDREFVTYFSLSCQNCPDVVQGLNIISVLNPRIKHTALDGAVFPDEVEARQVKSVPTVFEGDEMFESGRMTVEQILSRLDTGMGEKIAAEIDAKDPFDVLVIGGGPAGASAAIYAARKGIRTGLVAERFGGQVLDTMSIENLISVTYTEGPKLAAALEAHVNEYDVDVMDLQRVANIVPAEAEGGYITVELESGATLQSRTVILSTGARWRTMGVPGEDEYRNAGVTFCPHCDGPLFKGKRVAVIGGGNSGVEAAIDLAGLVDGVTVLEFQDTLLADEVLQRKMATLGNVEVIRSAQTTEVVGDGSGVTALTYIDRTDGSEKTVDLEGVFVQIGLLPNTEWLEGTVELSPRREIVIDDRGATSIPGVFAAGDCTTVPYKQIVVSLGAGSTAALSAFDYLIRHNDPADSVDVSAPDAQADPALANA